MRIGITYDLKADIPSSSGLSDDLQEEFDSPVTIETLACVLRDLGHEVVLLGNGREVLKKLLSSPPDVGFNIAEGQGISSSRETRVSEILEMLNIQHTSSDPSTLSARLAYNCYQRITHAA